MVDTHIPRRTFLCATSSTLALGAAGCNELTDGQDNEPTETDTDGDRDTGTGTETETETETGFTPAADDARVSFVTPSDGQTVSGGVSLVMEAENFTIEESGEVNDNAGHFHVLVDTDPVKPGESIPDDDQHVHFGDASTESVLALQPGDHSLTLQVGDGQHRAYDVTATVEVTIEQASAQFTNVDDGDTVSNPVRFEWQTENYTLESSGEVRQGSGHAHLIVDTDPVPVGNTIPSDDQHVHFGDGSASGELDLDTGEHAVTLQMGNGHHLATPVTDTVNITVE